MKRRDKSTPLSALVEFDSLEESSEDSDFRIEDHLDQSSEEDATIGDDSEDSEDKYDNNKDDSNSSNPDENHLQNQLSARMEISKILICSVCLGDDSNYDNEIVECDNCGVTVHEDCYGISDNDSDSSSDSESSKMPWFCEACQAGKKTLSCELCPNVGGVFKETDMGKWVHLVCALYVPGVAFKDVDKLSNVTLFEMSYSKWSERGCSLCPDQQFIQTGVCIECDAGLCKTYFHVTCAQKEGLLAEAQSEEINHADPFYAHCKLHSDREVSKLRKRNWLALELQMANRKKQIGGEGSNDLPKDICVENKLQKYQHKYIESKTNRVHPWIPTQKMARPLTSCARTLRALSRKATLSGIDTQAMALKQAHTNALADVHRKWHISPAFNVEYMGYYLDRNCRISSLKQSLDLRIKENLNLIKEQKELEMLYNSVLKDYHAEEALNKKLSSVMKTFLEILPRDNFTNKLSKSFEALCNISETQSSTAGKLSPQALESAVNLHFENKPIDGIPENLCLKCVTCSLATDQHLLVKCDTCQLHYHLSCLDPPLTRMPKKTRVMGWQCAECGKSSSDSEVEIVDTDTPRQLRQLKGNLKNYKQSFRDDSEPKNKREKENHDLNIVTSEDGTNVSSVSKQTCNKQLNTKKERSMCQRDIIGLAESEAQKTKQHSLKTSKSDIKQIVAVKTPCIIPQLSVVTTETVSGPKLSSVDINHPPKPAPKKFKTPGTEIVCDTCNITGTRANIVTCDECQKSFHFLCLNPPVKKSPKTAGYSWHCADCDPSESESD